MTLALAFSPSHLRAQQSNVAARTSPGSSAESMLERRVTIHLMDVSLKRAVDSVSRLAHVFVEYDLPLLQVHRTLINVDVTEKPLGIVLEQILSGTSLRVIPGSSQSLTIVASSESRTDSLPQVGIVSGRVVDSATGRGLRGATIKVAGDKLSTVTEDSGYFTLRTIPTGSHILTIRLFGYRPAERDVEVRTGRSTRMIHIQLGAAPNVLSGVVTTATGVQRKLEVGNDITTLNADSIMRVAPVSTVTDLLETRVPGLTVLHTSGTPGDPSRIRIRGATSITGNNDPIVIVDGVRVYASQSDARNANLAPSSEIQSNYNGYGTQAYAAPSPIDQIDPNSIETIEVLKGPSASALYGSDAANGVIVITTKKGRAGSTHWNVALGAGMTFESGDWPVNYYRFGYGLSSGTRGSPFCSWDDLSCTVDSVVPFQALNDPRYTIFADHGSNQNASATVSGGSAKLQYSLTGSAAGNLGILKLPALEQERYEDYYQQTVPGWMRRPDRYTSAGGSGQLTVQLASNASATVSSSLFSGNQQRSSLESAITQLEGKYINPTILSTAALIQGEVERATDDQLSSTNALAVNWRPLTWLPLTAIAGFNTIQRTDETYIPYGIYSGSITDAAGDTTGYYGLGKGSSDDKTVTVNTTIPLRGLNLAMGVNMHAGSTADVTAYTQQLAPGVTTPTNFPISCDGTDDCSAFSQSMASASTYGWFVEPQLRFHSRFFATPGFRLDGGSATGSNAGLSGFPKINFSWLAVDPEHPRGWLTLFRPRLALGVAGTQPGPADRLRLFNGSYYPTTIVVNGTTVPSVFVSSLGNTQLRPETSKEIEGGADATLWGNRLDITYTRFGKARSNAIITIPVATSVSTGSGGQQILYNIGRVNESGNEFTVTAQLVERRAFSWNANASVSNATNRLVRLNPGTQTYGTGVAGGNGTVEQNVVGYPLFGRWVLPIVAYGDANGDGIIEANEVRFGDSLAYAGSSEPKYQATFNTGMTLFNGRLTVSASFFYQNGLTQFNEGALTSGAFALLGNAPGASLGTQAALVAAGVDNGFSGADDAIGLIQTVNILRFQSLSIMYTVPSRMSVRWHVPDMSVALQGSNLGVHTNYRGLDPNVNAYSTGNATADVGQLPEPRTWLLRITLGN